MDIQSIAKFLILAGVSLAIVGVILLVGARLGLGSLPGDLKIEGKSGSLFIPITTSIVLSLLLTIVLNVILRWFSK